MRLYLFACIGWFCALSVGSAQTERLQVNDVRESVARAVSWLESDMVVWKERRHCAACHHGPLYLWSINVARRQGYKINAAQLDDLSQWLIENNESRIFPKIASKDAGLSAQKSADTMSAAMMGQNNLSQPTIYMLPAIRSMNESDPLRKVGWERVVKHLASAQHSDGAFVGRDAWRPIFNTPSVITLQIVSGLNHLPPTMELNETKTILKSAMNYLANNPVDDSQQALVFQILAAKGPAQLPDRDLRSSELIGRLMKLQNGDGGWAQTTGRDSDAFATGQALFALREAGFDYRHGAVQRGIDFLIEKQQSDGTWPMLSRPNPEDGKPASNLNPITYAAAAWAVLGMASHVTAE